MLRLPGYVDYLIGLLEEGAVVMADKGFTK